MLENETIKKYKHIHMIGIGGTSMSGIAEILLNLGHTVTGSDIAYSSSIKKLEDSGIRVFMPHNANNIIGADLVVYSAAIKKDNPEMVAAQNNKIPILERCEILGELTEMFSETIAISGTHGKTTTSSMISLCFLEDNKNPSIQVGADITNLDSNYRVGDSEYFIIEACEYVESFLKLRPKTEVILNIEEDHLDYYTGITHIKSSFTKFIRLLPSFSGLLVINGDDINCVEVMKNANSKVVTYGLNNLEADFIAKNITFDNNGFGEFDVFRKNKFYLHVKLSVPGIHNVSNALACIATCCEHKLSEQAIINGLEKFTGAARRFEFKGKFNNVSIFDDYAHHPSEISATLSALRGKKYNKSWVVFQPHTYTRTKAFLNEFAKSLLRCDNIIITDIYAAREKDPGDISSIDLVNKIKELGKEAKYFSNFEEVVKYIKENATDDDIVLTLGAGTVTNIGSMLAN